MLVASADTKQTSPFQDGRSACSFLSGLDQGTRCDYPGTGIAAPDSLPMISTLGASSVARV